MKPLKIILIVLGILFLLCVLCSLCVYILLGTFQTQTNTSITNPIQIFESSSSSLSNKSLDSSQFNFTNIKGGSLKSINDSNIKVVKADRIQILSLEFLNTTFDLAKNKNWGGVKDSPIPLTISDYAQSDLDSWVNTAKEKDENLLIPDDISSVYLGSTAISEITDEVFKAREEYISFLKSKGVNQKYIDEIENHTLPNSKDRFTYIAKNDPNAGVTGVSSFNGSNREAKYELQAVDIYLPSLLLKKSLIVGDEPSDISQVVPYFTKLRNMAIRMTTYHELTHILQRAVNYTNTAEGFKYPTVYIQSVKTSPEYNWGGEVTKDIYNRSIAEESQADGIAFVVLTSMYDMSNVQKEQVWDHFFGRLDNGAKQYESLMNKMETTYPKYNTWDFPQKIVEDVLYKGNATIEPAKTLVRLCDQTDIAAYGGYLNPMTPDKSELLWAFLKDLHRD
jgi:hypothetical protein